MRLAELDAGLGGEDESLDPDAAEGFAAMLVERGEILIELGRRQEAVACLEQVVHRFAASDGAEELVAAAFHLSARELGKLRRYEEAVAAADELWRRFAGRVEPEMRFRVAGGLAAKLTALAGLGRHAEAEVVADDLIAAFAEDPVQGPNRIDVIAAAFVIKAGVVNAQGRAEEAAAVIDELAARGSSEVRGQAAIAHGLNFKAGLLVGQDRRREALGVSEEVVSRFGGSPETALREQVAVALLARASALDRLGRGEEAISGWNDVIARYGDLTPPQRPRLALDAMYLRLIGLVKTGRVDDTVAACQALTDRFDQKPAPAAVPQLADALWRTSRLLSEAGQSERALGIIDDLLARFEETTDVRVRLTVLGAMNSKAGVLSSLGRLDDAVVVLDELSDRFADADPLSKLGVAAAGAGIVKAALLRKLKRVDESIAVCDELIDHVERFESIEAQTMFASAIERKCEALALAGRGPEMLAAEQQVLDRFQGLSDPQLRAHVARAQRGKAWALLHQGRIEDAIAVTDELLAQWESETDSADLILGGGLIVKCAGSLLQLGGASDQPKSSRLREGRRSLQTLITVGGIEPARLAFHTRQQRRAARRHHQPTQTQAAHRRPRVAISTQRRRAEQALKLTTAIVDRLQARPDGPSQDLTADARINQVRALTILGKWSRVVTTTNELVTTGRPAVAAFDRRSQAESTADHPERRLHHATLLMAKALIVDQQDDSVQTIAEYNAFIERYRDERSIPVRALVLAARGFRAKAARTARRRPDHAGTR